MKRTILAFFAITLLLQACNNETKNETATDSSNVNTSTASSDMKTEEKWVPMDTSKFGAAMQEYGTVGEPQKLLAKANGNWNAQVIFWMTANGKGDTSMSTLTNRMIMGDRYQVTNFKGVMMGYPFEGTSTTGFDNAKKMYTSSWIDNMSTGIMYMEGPYDAATKTITFTGEGVSPVDGRTCNVKQVYRFVDDNTHVMEMYGPDPLTGVPFKNMLMTMTRKK